MFINRTLARWPQLHQNRSLGFVEVLLMVLVESVIQAFHQSTVEFMNNCNTSQLTSEHCLQNISSMELNLLVLQFNNSQSERNVTNLRGYNLTEELDSTQELSLYSESCRQTFGMSVELANLNESRRHQLLIEAIGTCNMTLAEALILLGTNVTIQGPYTMIPLHLAAFLGRVEMASLFVTAGAEINARDESGRTALQCAFLSPNADAMIRLLAANGADLEVVNSKMQTPLHLAALFGLPTLRTLVALGANKEARDRDGRTPLDLARSQGRTEVVTWLSEQ